MTDKTIINLNISKGAKQIIYVIKSYGKECYPSIDTLCSKADMSKNTLRKYLKELLDNGYLKILPRKKSNNAQITNEYILNIPKEKKTTLKDKIAECKELAKNKEIKKAADNTPLPKIAPQEYIYTKNKHNSKSNSINRPRLAELKELENLEKDKSIPVDRDALQTMKNVFYSVCTCNLDKYTINQKQISKQSIIDKIKSLSIYDYKNIVNAITGKKIRHKYSYIINTLLNYGTNQEQKNSTWNLSQKQDYDFELLESL